MTGILHPGDLWHTGIVVDDLEAAKTELTATMGLAWMDGGAEVRLVTDEGTTTVTTAYALSTQGPHHIELGASIPDTLWSVGPPGQAHHVGYWVDDVVAVSDELSRRGAPRLAAVTMRDDLPPMCAYHRSASGLIVEIVTRKMQSILLPPDRVEHPTTGANDG